MDYALSNSDLNTILEPDTNVFLYPHLKSVSNIDEVLDDNGRAIMLYLTENDSTGHWIAIIKRGDTVEVYDPYGFATDTQHKHLGGSVMDNARWGQDKKVLTRLIRASGYKLRDNREQQQKMSPDINTCGRWAVVRLLFSHLPVKEFNKMINSVEKKMGITGDEVVMAITSGVLGK
jgi:hypothetical protein